MIESYKTIKKSYGPLEFKEKGSSFIAYLFFADNKESADIIIEKLRKQHYDATHVCWAYRFGCGEEKEFRYSDDGEPSGTAGLPIFKEIERVELFNVVAAVVRYFGGTKLGTGGLVRAYSSAIRYLLEMVEPEIINIKEQVSFSVPFDFIGGTMHIINITGGVEIFSQDYNENGVLFSLLIPVKKTTLFKESLKEKTAGKIILP